MDKLHIALMEELLKLQKAEEEIKKYRQWWQDEQAVTAELKEKNHTLESTIEGLKERIADFETAANPPMPEEYGAFVSVSNALKTL